MESSEWPVKGILYGTEYHLGIWYECLHTEGPHITGQYCVVEATLQFKFDAELHPKTSDWVEHPLQNFSAWNVLKMVLLKFFFFNYYYYDYGQILTELILVCFLFYCDQLKSLTCLFISLEFIIYFNIATILIIAPVIVSVSLQYL